MTLSSKIKVPDFKIKTGFVAESLSILYALILDTSIKILPISCLGTFYFLVYQTIDQNVSASASGASSIYTYHFHATMIGIHICMNS